MFKWLNNIHKTLLNTINKVINKAISKPVNRIINKICKLTTICIDSKLNNKKCNLKHKKTISSNYLQLTMYSYTVIKLFNKSLYLLLNLKKLRFKILNRSLNLTLIAIMSISNIWTKKCKKL